MESSLWARSYLGNIRVCSVPMSWIAPNSPGYIAFYLPFNLAPPLNLGTRFLLRGRVVTPLVLITRNLPYYSRNLVLNLHDKTHKPKLLCPSSVGPVWSVRVTGLTGWTGFNHFGAPQHLNHTLSLPHQFTRPHPALSLSSRALPFPNPKLSNPPSPFDSKDKEGSNRHGGASSPWFPPRGAVDLSFSWGKKPTQGNQAWLVDLSL